LKAAIYVRVSTADQHVESQLYDLRELAAKRGFEIVKEYQDCGISGRRARRPGLDALISDARQRKFSVVLVAAFDRVARSVKHFLQLMRSLIAFAAWSCFAHAVTMSIQGLEIASQRVGFLVGSAVLVVIGVALIALAPERQPVERTSTVAA